MVSQIRELLNLITDAVNKLEKICDNTGSSIPDLHTPFSPQSEAFRQSPEAAESANIISAAALQLNAILAPPHITFYHVVSGALKAAALRACLESNVTEILREAGPQGIHVNDIGTKNGQDPRKLARFLRYLATSHIYCEITPEVFANTRISSMMDTLKPSQEIISHPESKHENTAGLAALASHHLDEMFKAAAYVWETLADPTTAHSCDPTTSPFARAFKAKETETFWDLQARDKFRSSRFNIGMRGTQVLQSVNSILKGYDWGKVPAGSVIVDVGGGVGSASIPLAREFPSLNIIVQDRPSVIKDAKEFWRKNLPTYPVTLEVQDFFAPQPVNRDVTVFLLKQILHDWSDEYCVRILTQIRAVAREDTRLLLIENLIPFACRDPSRKGARSIPGYAPHEAPRPLLANFGAVNDMTYQADMGMFLLFNSQERTIHHINRLLLSTGWNVKRVYHQDDGNCNAFLQSIEAVPIDVLKM